ncbi:hypothetical protein A9W99_08070 [Mycobacterium sp. 1164966.3]|uniref:hypothetical protein n=1 Tax=Mycobacterium sp. 1164966.3 TaxID=1856861 RepID=UPI0007FC7AF3|nr:hypothetical protein [Mycobacterium sp. 1164966.3]OBA83418.1 hypothetical protein A9W99_08070 [Mycobacterium sp. 1164966.3]
MTMRRAAWWLLVSALTVGTLAAVSVGGWQLVIKAHRLPPVADQLAARQDATRAASAGTVKLMTYSPDTLDQDFASASELLTGEFREYYQKFTSQTVKPTAQQKRVKSAATVQRAGVQSLTRDAAVVLVFVKRTTTTADQPSPTEVPNAVRVGLAKVHGTWLINRFDPV